MSFAENTYKNTIYRGGQVVTSFLLNLLMARLFRAEASGILFYWIGVLSLLLLVCSFNLNTGIAYYFSAKKINERPAFVFAVAATVLLVIISAICLPVLKKGYQYDFDTLPALAFISGNFLIVVFQYLFYAKSDFRTTALVSIIISVVTMIGGLLLNTVFQHDHQRFVSIFTAVYLYSFLIAGLVQLVIFYVRYVGDATNLLERNYARKILRYSIMALTSNLISFFLYRIDYWFVAHYCNLNDLGNYVQVSKLNTMFFILPNIFSINIFIAGAAVNDRAASTVYLEKLSAILFWLLGTVMLTLLLFGHYLFPFFFGDSFQSMSGYFNRMCAGVLLYILMMPFASYFAAQNKIYVNIITTTIALGIMVAGNIIFTRAYGANAAALVCGVAYGINAILIIGYYKLTNGISFLNMLRFSNKDLLFFRGMIRNKIVKP